MLIRFVRVIGIYCIANLAQAISLTPNLFRISATSLSEAQTLTHKSSMFVRSLLKWKLESLTSGGN